MIARTTAVLVIGLIAARVVRVGLLVLALVVRVDLRLVRRIRLGLIAGVGLVVRGRSIGRVGLVAAGLITLEQCLDLAGLVRVRPDQLGGEERMAGRADG